MTPFASVALPVTAVIVSVSPASPGMTKPSTRAVFIDALAMADDDQPIRRRRARIDHDVDRAARRIAELILGGIAEGIHARGWRSVGDHAVRERSVASHRRDRLGVAGKSWDDQNVDQGRLIDALAMAD